VADETTSQPIDAPANGASIPSMFGRTDSRAGSWLPIWRVAGLLFIAYPVVRIATSPIEPLVAALALAATAIFAVMVFAIGRSTPSDPRRANPIWAGLDLAMLALATAAVLRGPDEGWVVLYYYASTAASMLLPERRALALIGAAGVVCAITFVPIYDLASAVVQGLSVSVIGVTVFAMAALRRTNAQLYAARQELATMAVAQERNRIARDLHDVLGHSLSLIAIKSELAGRLLPGDPERARDEIADVERVARESLASVRETVSGYRQPTLERELTNAQAVLDAAGIAPTIDHQVGPLPAQEDAVLAWALREAVTNVVRHSAARHGTIRTARHGMQAELEVLDDGSGDGATPTADATGLLGLRERLELAGGRLEAGPQPAGGYRLFASIPLRTPPAAQP
jgi:two-component system, NarL family, sensor histidine kinase DesK